MSYPIFQRFERSFEMLPDDREFWKRTKFLWISIFYETFSVFAKLYVLIDGDFRNEQYEDISPTASKTGKKPRTQNVSDGISKVNQQPNANIRNA